MDHDAPRPFVSALEGRVPTVDDDAWIAPTASVVGEVSLGAGSSVWYSAVLRADDEVVTVGAGSNVQDGAVLHADPGYPCVLGDGVTVGHGAIVHGATIGAGSLVGMGARVLNGATIGENSLVAAGALVPEGFAVPSGVLVLGAPAKVRRELDEEELGMLRETAEDYVAKARRHRRAAGAGSGG